MSSQTHGQHLTTIVSSSSPPSIHSQSRVIQLLLKGIHNHPLHLLEARSKQRETPLAVAVRAGAPVSVVQLLLHARAHAAILDSAGYSPLAHAAASNSPEILECLLLHGAGNIHDPHDHQHRQAVVSPHQVAARLGHMSSLALLLAAGAQGVMGWPQAEKTRGDSVLHTAIRYNHPHCLAIIMAHCPRLIQKENTTPFRDTPLFLAIRLDHVECVTQLLQRGAPVNARNRQGQSALYLSIVYRRLDCLRALLRLDENENDDDDDDDDHHHHHHATAALDTMSMRYLQRHCIHRHPISQPQQPPCIVTPSSVSSHDHLRCFSHDPIHWTKHLSEADALWQIRINSTFSPSSSSQTLPRLQTYHVHECILAARHPVFRAQLVGSWASTTQAEKVNAHSHPDPHEQVHAHLHNPLAHLSRISTNQDSKDPRAGSTFRVWTSHVDFDCSLAALDTVVTYLYHPLMDVRAWDEDLCLDVLVLANAWLLEDLQQVCLSQLPRWSTAAGDAQANEILTELCRSLHISPSTSESSSGMSMLPLQQWQEDLEALLEHAWLADRILVTSDAREVYVHRAILAHAGVNVDNFVRDDDQDDDDDDDDEDNAQDEDDDDDDQGEDDRKKNRTTRIHSGRTAIRIVYVAWPHHIVAPLLAYLYTRKWPFKDDVPWLVLVQVLQLAQTWNLFDVVVRCERQLIQAFEWQLKDRLDDVALLLAMVQDVSPALASACRVYLLATTVPTTAPHVVADPHQQKNVHPWSAQAASWLISIVEHMPPCEANDIFIHDDTHA